MYGLTGFDPTTRQRLLVKRDVMMTIRTGLKTKAHPALVSRCLAPLPLVHTYLGIQLPSQVRGLIIQKENTGFWDLPQR